ncbi:translation initiation factor IF-2 [Streptomyces sp. NPDC056242]|uniref:translation initiation factor IF-2 n=1 Tax=unclassified Streptomyces TaxID=2593676 RepID=UPI0035D65043
MARDPFDGMSHEQMLEWLDQANSGTVQAAAARLAAAAKEIHSIAEDLKVRPQWVEWKGEGAESFRTWAGDLANATLTLGDFSQDSSKWLAQASTAIGNAQAAIPRDKASATANLEAAKAAHNDPDAGAVASKSTSELQAIAANKEKVREEAAGEMRKLGQAYSLSSTQMDGLTRPKFPPPPKAFVPEKSSIDEVKEHGYGGSAAQASSESGLTGSTPVVSGHAGTIPGATTPQHDVTAPERTVPAFEQRPTEMGIDSVETLPDVRQNPTTTGPGPSPAGPSAPGPVGTPPTTGMIPPAFGGPGRPPLTGRATGPAMTARGTSPQGGPGVTGRPNSPATANGLGRPTTPGARGPMLPGQNATGTGRSVPGANSGRLPTNNGVAGGRPQQTTGRSTGIPRGTVMGGERAAGGRSTTGQGVTGGRPTATGGSAGSRGAVSGRRAGGVTGENGGVVGGRPQQQSRANARSFSPGGSGLVRGQGAGGDTSESTRGTGQAGRGGAMPHGSRPDGSQSERKGERPDYLVEDEETWQPNNQGNVPPVVDDKSNNSER